MAKLVIRTQELQVFTDDFQEVDEATLNGSVAKAVESAIGNVLYNTNGMRVKPDKIEFTIGTKNHRATYQVNREDYDPRPRVDQQGV